MEQLIYPRALQPGDRVVIVSPSGQVDPAYLAGAQARLASWGLRVEVSPHAAGGYATFSGTVEERLSDLQSAFDDPTVRAIVCSRGGYGAVHLLERLDFHRFRRSPKWLVGFSDITALHCLLQSQGFASVHSLMAKHLSIDPVGSVGVACLHAILFGGETGPEGAGTPCGPAPETGTIALGQTAGGPTLTYTQPPHALDHAGHAEGILRGGNLAVSYGLRGTPYDIPPQGTILFIEDVSEKPHAVERMLYNLRLAGVLPRLSGLIIGQFTDYEEHHQLGKDLYGAIGDLVADYHYPIAFDFPVGHHIPKNLPLIAGARVSLTVDSTHQALTFPLTGPGGDAAPAFVPAQQSTSRPCDAHPQPQQ